MLPRQWHESDGGDERAPNHDSDFVVRRGARSVEIALFLWRGRHERAAQEKGRVPKPNGPKIKR